MKKKQWKPRTPDQREAMLIISGLVAAVILFLIAAV